MDVHGANGDVGWVGFHPLKSLSMDRRCNNDVHLCVDSFGFGWGLWSWGVVLFPLEHQSGITLITVFKGTVKMQNRKSFVGSSLKIRKKLNANYFSFLFLLLEHFLLIWTHHYYPSIFSVTKIHRLLMNGQTLADRTKPGQSFQL